MYIFNPEDPSLSPTEVCSFSVTLFERNENGKEAGVCLNYNEDTNQIMKLKLFKIFPTFAILFYFQFSVQFHNSNDKFKDM